MRETGTLPWVARINLQDSCRHKRSQGTHCVFKKRLTKASFQLKLFLTKGRGTSARGKASRLTGRGRAGQ